jgi:hypothetical protein
MTKRITNTHQDQRAAPRDMPLEALIQELKLTAQAFNSRGGSRLGQLLEESAERLNKLNTLLNESTDDEF